MTRTHQKNRERFFVERCAELLGVAWTIEEEGERPDFIISDGETTFGLEVTEVFKDQRTMRGSRMRLGEAGRQATVDRLKAEYEATGRDTPLKVQLVGHLSAQDLREIVPALLSKNLQSRQLTEWYRFECSEGLSVHARISTRSDWKYLGDAIGGVFRDHHAVPRLTEAIVSKARKLSEYRKRAGDDVRLLLFSNRLRRSGKLTLGGATAISRHGFSRVYFMSYPELVFTLPEAAP